MPEGQEQEIYQAQYPALARCMLVDARLNSRQDIAKDLKSTGLFEDIVQAKFLDEGLTILQQRQIDACFLGPTVTRPKAVDFIQKAKQILSAEDTALVAIVPVDGEDVHTLFDAGVHWTICKPYGKKDFREGIVKAVIRANEDGVWVGVALKMLGEDYWTVADFMQREEQMMATSIARRAATALNSVVLSWREKKFGLDEYGEPTPDTAAELDRVSRELTNPHRHCKAIIEFNRHMRSCLNEWFVELTTTNQKMANRSLLRKIRAFETAEQKEEKKKKSSKP